MWEERIPKTQSSVSGMYWFQADHLCLLSLGFSWCKEGFALIYWAPSLKIYSGDRAWKNVIETSFI